MNSYMLMLFKLLPVFLLVGGLLILSVRGCFD